MVDYTCGKFGDCNFSRFGSIVQTHALLSSAWVMADTTVEWMISYLFPSLLYIHSAFYSTLRETVKWVYQVGDGECRR